MNRSLGLCVTTPGCAGHVAGLLEAAQRKGIRVEVFLTGDGVEVIRDPRFSVLLAADRVAVCEVSFLQRGFRLDGVQGLEYRDLTTQAFNADIVARCDRYLVL